jgi:hypothetical protein
MLAGAITTEANSPFTPVMSPNDRPAGGIGDLLYVLGIYANTGRPNVFATCQDGNTDKFPICYLAGHGGGGWVSSLVSTSGTVARDGLYQPEEGLMLNLGMQREISEYYGANLISPYTGSYYALIQEEIAGCQIPGGHIPYYAYNAGSRGSPLLAAGQPGSSAHSMLTDNTGKSLCLSGGGGRGAHGGRVAISPRSATDAWLYCGYGGGGGVGSLIAAGNLEPYAYVRDYTPGVASTPGMVYGSPDEQGKVYVTGYSS